MTESLKSYFRDRHEPAALSPGSEKAPPGLNFGPAGLLSLNFASLLGPHSNFTLINNDFNAFAIAALEISSASPFVS